MVERKESFSIKLIRAYKSHKEKVKKYLDAHPKERFFALFFVGLALFFCVVTSTFMIVYSHQSTELPLNNDNVDIQEDVGAEDDDSESSDDADIEENNKNKSDKTEDETGTNTDSVNSNISKEHLGCSKELYSNYFDKDYNGNPLILEYTFVAGDYDYFSHMFKLKSAASACRFKMVGMDNNIVRYGKSASTLEDPYIYGIYPGTSTFTAVMYDMNSKIEIATARVTIHVKDIETLKEYESCVPGSCNMSIRDEIMQNKYNNLLNQLLDKKWFYKGYSDIYFYPHRNYRGETEYCTHGITIYNYINDEYAYDLDGVKGYPDTSVGCTDYTSTIKQYGFYKLILTNKASVSNGVFTILVNGKKLEFVAN